MDARRTRSLIRDEGRLRVALAEHERRRFDVDTALTVKRRVEDLLETVGIIVQDQDFWDRLGDLDRPPSSQQLERVRQLDPLAFAALLEAAGYSSPPPPPVEELVDDTITALVVAVTAPTHRNVDEAGGARWQLQTLVMRVRRQINEQATPELAPSVLRSSARSVGRAARWLIPRVVGATAGAVLEAHAPGSGLGLIAWRSVQRTAEDLGELTTEMVLGDPSPAPSAVSTDEPAWTEIDPLSLHIAALADQLHAVSDNGPLFDSVGMSAEQLGQTVRESRRHLDRIEELAHDGSRETASIRRHIRRLREALDELSQDTGPHDSAFRDIAMAANSEVAQLREYLTGEALPCTDDAPSPEQAPLSAEDAPSPEEPSPTPEETHGGWLELLDRGPAPEKPGLAWQGFGDEGCGPTTST
jgi:hypothetical protein